MAPPAAVRPGVPRVSPGHGLAFGAIYLHATMTGRARRRRAVSSDTEN